jgi:hypothetical protein
MGHGACTTMSKSQRFVNGMFLTDVERWVVVMWLWCEKCCDVAVVVIGCEKCSCSGVMKKIIIKNFVLFLWSF